VNESETIEALGRLHATKVRLLGLGWRFEEESDGVGFDVEVGHPACPRGARKLKKFRRHFYSDALDDALKYASAAQARKDAAK